MNYRQRFRKAFQLAAEVVVASHLAINTVINSQFEDGTAKEPSALVEGVIVSQDVDIDISKSKSMIQPLQIIPVKDCYQQVAIRSPRSTPLMLSNEKKKSPGPLKSPKPNANNLAARPSESRTDELEICAVETATSSPQCESENQITETTSIHHREQLKLYR